MASVLSVRWLKGTSLIDESFLFEGLSGHRRIIVIRMGAEERKIVRVKR